MASRAKDQWYECLLELASMADGDSRLRCTLCNKMATQKSIGAYNQTLDLKNALRAHVNHNCEPMQAMPDAPTAESSAQRQLQTELLSARAPSTPPVGHHMSAPFATPEQKEKWGLCQVRRPGCNVTCKPRSIVCKVRQNESTWADEEK